MSVCNAQEVAPWEVDEVLADLEKVERERAASVKSETAERVISMFQNMSQEERERYASDMLKGCGIMDTVMFDHVKMEREDPPRYRDLYLNSFAVVNPTSFWRITSA